VFVLPNLLLSLFDDASHVSTFPHVMLMRALQEANEPRFSPGGIFPGEMCGANRRLIHDDVGLGPQDSRYVLDLADDEVPEHVYIRGLDQGDYVIRPRGGVGPLDS